MRKLALFLNLIIFIYMSPSIVSGAIIHVPADQPTIQAGIDAAVDGDTVLVADGKYTGYGNRDIEFNGKAITVMSENGAASCVIDCEGTEEENHRGFNFSGDEGENSVIQGFTIQNGYADDGGGIYCHSSSPTITNCTFTNNTAYRGGGFPPTFPPRVLQTALLQGTQQLTMEVEFTAMTTPPRLLLIALLQETRPIMEVELIVLAPPRLLQTAFYGIMFLMKYMLLSVTPLLLILTFKVDTRVLEISVQIHFLLILDLTTTVFPITRHVLMQALINMHL